jgi:hypothetical protein
VDQCCNENRTRELDVDDLRDALASAVQKVDLARADQVRKMAHGLWNLSVRVFNMSDSGALGTQTGAPATVTGMDQIRTCVSLIFKSHRPACSWSIVANMFFKCGIPVVSCTGDYFWPMYSICRNVSTFFAWLHERLKDGSVHNQFLRLCFQMEGFIPAVRSERCHARRTLLRARPEGLFRVVLFLSGGGSPF